jgi:hypothetical protein
MAETTADWVATRVHDDSSDTDRAAESSVFAAVSPGDQRSTEGSTMASEEAPVDDGVEEPESRVDAKVESVEAKAQETKRALDLRRLVEEHPIAVGAVVLGAIGLGVIGYRSVRNSLPIRLFLALRFGRVQELWKR